MSFFSGSNYSIDEESKMALLAADCAKSEGIILEFIEELEVLQSFMNQKRYKEGAWMAQRCCDNDIIACDTDKLPTVGLKTVQGMILDEIAQLDSAFCHDAGQGLYNIAADGNCPSIVNICRHAISQLRAARR